MSRHEDHFEAMLRHLGAAYYQTLQGTATPADVAAALDSVERESASHHGAAGPHQENAHARGKAHTGKTHTAKTGRWRVRDVMTRRVISVTRRTSGPALARLLSEHHINAVPVLTGEGKLAGVVSEADLLRAQQSLGAGRGKLLHRRRQAQYTAGHLMTAPAITIHPEAPLAAAARRMTEHHLTLLPVVDEAGDLIGVISRRDLLSVYLRPDGDIAAEVAGVLSDMLFLDPAAVTVHAHEGLVTLTGQVERPGIAALAVRLAEGVDGVLAVIDHLTATPVGAGHPGH